MSHVPNVISSDHAVALVARFLDEHFPDADAAFIGGSVMRGQATAYSDIDVVILRPRVESGSRQVFSYDGVPVETFVQDDETLRWFLDSDRVRGRPVLLRLVAEGAIIGPRTVAARQWQAWAQSVLADGPAPLAQAQREQMRYAITDRIDDLRGGGSREEVFATAAELYPLLAELILRGAGHWFGSGKWIPRLLRQADAQLAQRFVEAFDQLLREGDTGPVIAFAEQEMPRHGGFLSVGSKQFAPATSRTTK